MSPPALVGLTLLGSYLIGAIPFGYLVARWKGIDILRAGSGNIGATNVGRILGRRLGILVFLLDFAKGAAPVAAAVWVANAQVISTIGPHGLPVVAGLAAFAGHLFPIYLRFRGGKGVATGAGVVSVLLPGPASAALLVWLGVVVASRYVSLASICAALTLCLLQLLVPEPFGFEQRILSVFCLVAAGLVVLRHRSNIARLLEGKENRLGETPIMLLLTKTVHVLALGLWFGMLVFFLVLGLVLFPAFAQLAQLPRDQRPLWFPLPAQLDRERPSEHFPDPLRREQGSRVVGAAVAPLFPWYFGIQLVCGFLATSTAIGWPSSGNRLQKWRRTILMLALALVVGGWLLQQHVSDLREPRDAMSDLVLREDRPSTESIQDADNARAEFTRWHNLSLIVNFATLLLVGIGLALAAHLPTTPAPEGKEEASGPG